MLNPPHVVNWENLNNEIVSLRVSAEQLQRLVEAINKAMPDFVCAFGSECDHAEAALRRLIQEHAEMKKTLSALDLTGAGSSKQS